MRLAALPAELPLWPPLVASRGPGTRSAGHSHHAMHLVLATSGQLRVRVGRGRWVRAAGVLTAPNVEHSIDAQGIEIFIVFVDPESLAGAALSTSMPTSVRLVSAKQREQLLEHAEPRRVMQADGVDYIEQVVRTLVPRHVRRPRHMHPRVRRVLKQLREGVERQEASATSLEALAKAAGLSSSRFMHAFTESLGIPLRPYLAWLRLQRAAAYIVSGRSLSFAAAEAGFSDAAHLSRSFRRAFGMTPSMLRRSTRVLD